MAAPPHWPSLAALRQIPDRFFSVARSRRWASIASAVWVVAVVTYAIGFFGASAGGRGTVFLDGMFFLVGLILPLLLIWLAAYLAEELERERNVIAALAEVAVPLIGALNAVRASLDAHAPASPQEIQKAVQGAILSARGTDMGASIERVLSGQAQLQTALSALTARTGAPAAATKAGRRSEKSDAPLDGKAAPTPLGPSPELTSALATEAATASGTERDSGSSSRLDWAELIRALDFPRDADDREGFLALKSALREPRLAQMLQAAEDVLTLLSQEGVYVDDLTVEKGDAGAWRRFIAGGRGAEVASVGGIRDPRALDLARELIKADPIFRDTTLFFQRRFDVVLSEFAANASDAQLLELANTRSGRAFVLMARLNGAFD